MMDIREHVIAKAKALKAEGIHHRFFSVNGQLWECYQAEYLPDHGERSWHAAPIKFFVMYLPEEPPSEAQQFGMDLWSGIK